MRPVPDTYYGFPDPYGFLYDTSENQEQELVRIMYSLNYYPLKHREEIDALQNLLISRSWLILSLAETEHQILVYSVIDAFDFA